MEIVMKVKIGILDTNVVDNGLSSFNPFATGNTPLCG